MNQDQINSIVRTALKIAGAILVKHGLSDYATIINTPDVAGLIVLLVGLWLSHQNHGANSAIRTATEDLAGIIAEFGKGPTPTPGTTTAPVKADPSPASVPAGPVAGEAPSTAGGAPALPTPQSELRNPHS